MRRIAAGCASALLITAAFTGCGLNPAKAPEKPKPDAGKLMADWIELATSDDPNLDYVTASMIVEELVRDGLEGLDPILEVLADPEGHPMAKVLAVISLSPYMNPSFAPRLIEMSREGNETTTRSCAAHLLGLIDSPEAAARIRDLLEDPEQRVRTAAAIIRLKSGDTKILADIGEIYHNVETLPKQRGSILLMMPDAHVEENLDLYKQGVADSDLDSEVRAHAANVLGRIGGDDAIELLEACVGKDPDEGVRDAAQSAITLIRMRSLPEPVAPGEPG